MKSAPAPPCRIVSVLVGSACLATLLLSVLSAPAAAQVTFDFESSAATYVSPPAVDRPGALTSLSLTSGVLTITVTRPNNTAFDIVDNTTVNQNGKPVSFGARSLDPFFAPQTNGWIINLSLPANSFGLDFGDFGVDADTLTLTAFTGLNGTGATVGTQTVSLGMTAFPQFAVIAVTGGGIRSVTLSGTSDTSQFENSVYLDNIRVSGIAPEPGTLSLLGLSLPGMFWAFHQRRRSSHRRRAGQ